MSMRIAVLGLGAMGTRMAKRLLEAGYAVTVWNRSPAPARALVSAGARHALTPREAAAEADFVIAMLRDDSASLDAWTHSDSGALAGMKPGAIAVESSTLSLDAIERLAAASALAGVQLLDAPVSGSRAAAQAGQLVYLVGGDAEAFRRAEPILFTLGAAAHHVGTTGHGAVAKLVTNALLGIHVTALAELIGLLHEQGISPEPVLKAVAATSVWAPVDHYLSGSMLTEDFTPQFPVELMTKDFGYTLSAAGGGGRMPVTAAALNVFKLAARLGSGDKNMTAVAQLYDRTNAPPQTPA